jgi:predicted HicB family RNase H-like nuclease
MSSGRFPDRFPADVTVEDVDLDETEVFVGRERLTEARATELAEQTLREVRRRNLVPGRKSLGRDGAHSPVIQVRVPADLRQAAEERAEADHVSVSVLVRRALESYLSACGRRSP